MMRSIRPRSRDGLPILTFHSFGTSRAVTSTDPSWFADTLGMLAEAGFLCLDIEDWVRRGRPDEPRGFALAVDDGLRSIYKIVDVLYRFKATATVFLTTGHLGKDNGWPGQPASIPIEPLLNWREIESLKYTGLKFAAHGVSHTRLDLDGDSERIIAELRGARDEIEEKTGLPCRLVAYPYGASNRVVRELASRFFLAGFGTRLDFADSTQDHFDIARLDAYYLRPNRLREALVSGTARSSLRWRRTLRMMKQSTLAAIARVTS